ncbi:MAG: NAD-dependent epimerase/dehydratase family protein [Pyrinomonadaceae bacterium]
MSVAIITGSSGLIGSETASFFHERGLRVVGVDNNMREYFFGADASTGWNTSRLTQSLRNFEHHSIDVRDVESVNKLFRRYGADISVVVHTAAQPSHDWAAREPFTDFTVNANGTLAMLEATRQFAPDATFIFTSTNKVYGDTPNTLPRVELETRWELDPAHPYAAHGVDELMSVDQSKHSLFGASKVAADVLVQEYGNYFGMRTGVFRGGCLTGPSHSGAELHGFLAYLVKCVVAGTPYTVYGYKGKQVRDNIHAYDLVNAFWHFFQNPKAGAVYNMGGSRHSNCSVLEAIRCAEEICGKRLNYTVSDEARSGDHIWWVSDVRKFRRDYPQWEYRHDLISCLTEIAEATEKRMCVPA